MARAGERRQTGRRLGRPLGGHVLDRASQQLESRRVELVRPLPDAILVVHLAIETSGKRLP
jgi:hypothetical protein